MKCKSKWNGMFCYHLECSIKIFETIRRIKNTLKCSFVNRSKILSIEVCQQGKKRSRRSFCLKHLIVRKVPPKMVKKLLTIRRDGYNLKSRRNHG